MSIPDRRTQLAELLQHAETLERRLDSLHDELYDVEQEIFRVEAELNDQEHKIQTLEAELKECPEMEDELVIHDSKDPEQLRL